MSETPQPNTKANPSKVIDLSPSMMPEPIARTGTTPPVITDGDQRAENARTGAKNTKSKARRSKSCADKQKASKAAKAGKKGIGDGKQRNNEGGLRFSYPVSLDDFSAEVELLEVINDPATKNADKIRAVTLLKEHLAEAARQDADSQVDPADVGAFLYRAKLNGEEPAAVLLKVNGLKRVCAAVGEALNLTRCSMVLGDTSADYEQESQCLKGDATDCESVGPTNAGGSAATIEEGAPPGADQ